MPALQLVVPRGEGFPALHRDWPSVPGLPASVAVVAAHSFLFPLGLSRCSLLGDPPCLIRCGDECLLSGHASAALAGYVCFPVRFLIARDARVPECPGIQRISVTMPCPLSARASLLIHRATCCPGSISRCVTRRTAAWESQKIIIFCTAWACSLSPLFAVSLRAIHISHNSASNTSI